MIPVILITL
jgi:hypothetical protein